MASFKRIMPALTASSVAMAIGAIARSSIVSSLPGPEIFPWSLTSVFFAAGAVIGALLAGPVWTRFGSLLGMAFFDAVLISGLFAITFSVGSVALIVAGKLFLGIGSGALTAIVPAYVGEISHPKLRGKLGMLFPAIMITGVVVSDAFGPLKQFDHQQPFNILFNAYCYLIVMLHAFELCIVPKSPYSLSNSFFEQDHSNTYSKNKNYDHVTARRSSWHILDALGNRADRRALLIGVGCMFFHQMCGISVMISYMNHIIKMVEIHVDSKMICITLGIFQIIMMGVAITIIDIIGRRILLISSAVTMCLCSAGLAFCVVKMPLNTFGNLSMILIIIFILAYSLGFGPVPWVIMGEIFSMKVKPYGISFATAVNWLIVLSGVCFPYEINKCLDTEYVFMVNLVLCLFSALFAWWIVPETKKKSLAQVQWDVAANFEVISYIPLYQCKM